ncbi:GNAT family N-acetyltransferase [Cellulomonas composti]|uniref:N-acetyltransferase n=1 Tax=Cellulomonas composti TaxID=266130 RepID=A0A511JB73_9CELL|nr:GNAT family N-acetyltransferase [Cellulomonas composti]GEL95235.1 N-acetyltransferase [Cellulomonas composti]
MAELGHVTWPPGPIATARILLRPPQARDRAAFVELYTSPDVGIYTGGARSREEVERALPEEPRRRPGLFVIDLDGAMVGMVQLERRDADYEVRQAAGQVDLGYLLLPEAWGRGYATEACEAALGWFAVALPGEAVVLITQTANTPSMRLAARLGFVEVERFEAYDAEQWFGTWTATTTG